MRDTYAETQSRGDIYYQMIMASVNYPLYFSSDSHYVMSFLVIQYVVAGYE